MYQPAYCSAFCLDQAKHLQHHNACDPCCQHLPVDYPSPCCCPLPNFNKHTFPKEKYDSCGVPPLRKKLKKKRRGRSSACQDNSNFMLNMCKQISPGQKKCCCSKKPNNSSDTKEDDCEPVEETCTQFMEIVQSAVQETVQESAKTTMDEIYQKISCKMDELVCQTSEIQKNICCQMEEIVCQTSELQKKICCEMEEMSCQLKEVKDVVLNVATKNDLRFKCICEFLFTHLNTASDDEEDDDVFKDVQDDKIEEIKKKSKSFEKGEKRTKCYCKHCEARREIKKSLLSPTLSASSQKSVQSDNSQQNTRSVKKPTPRNSNNYSTLNERNYTPSTVPSYKRESNNSMQSERSQRSQFQEDNCCTDYIKPSTICIDNGQSQPQCFCGICKCNYNTVDPLKTKTPSCCYCQKPRSASEGPPVPPRRSGGNNSSLKKRFRAQDYKPSLQRTQTLSTHCSRIDTLSKQSSAETKSSLPEIIIDENENSKCSSFREKSDSREKTVHFHKPNENYVDFSLRYESQDFRHMRSNL